MLLYQSSILRLIKMFTNALQLDSSIQKRIARCLSQLRNIDPSALAGAQSAMEKVDSEIKQLSSEMKVFQKALEDAPESKMETLKRRIHEHELWIHEIQSLVKAKKHEPLRRSVSKGRPSAESTLNKVLLRQGKAIDSLIRSCRTVGDAEGSAIVCIDSLARQRSIEGNINLEDDRINVNSSRIDSDIRWFSRNLVSDKLFLFMVGMALLAFLGVVGVNMYFYAQKKGNMSAIEQIHSL